MLSFRPFLKIRLTEHARMLRLVAHFARAVFIAVSIITAAAQLSISTAYSSEEAPWNCSIQYAMLRMRLKFNAFVTSRTLGEYDVYIAREFMQFLKSLGPGSHWLDAGSGEAIALTQYLERHPGKARVTGVVYSGKKPKKAPEQLRYLSGRYIEDIPDEELGRADLISDVFGPGSYSTRVSQVLNKYLRILNAGGRAFITLTSHSTVQVQGRNIPLQSYLLSLKPPPGIEFGYEGNTLIIRKMREVEFRLPDLELVSLESGAPPERVFRPRDTD